MCRTSFILPHTDKLHRHAVDMHIYHIPVFTFTRENSTSVSVSHEQIYTIFPLFYAFSPLCLLDGVELTGAESFTMSGSKDKLQNTHTEVTYVFVRLPDSFSSPTCSISPSLSLFLLSLVFTPLLFSPSVLVSTMNFCAERTVSWHCAIELASVKCTKLHSSSETDPILAGSPGAYTLNRAIDYFNPACLLCVRDNNLLSYSEITLVLRSCSVVQLCCRTAKVLSNIDAPSSCSHWADTAEGRVWLLRLTL